MNEKRYDFARFYEPGPRNSTLYVLRIYICIYVTGWRNRKGIIERFSGGKEEKNNGAEGSSGSFLEALSDDTRGRMST